MTAVPLGFDFPAFVNEKAARCVASGVLVLATIALATRSPWVPLVMAAGFALRVGWGPRFSPLAQVATRLVAPRLGAPRTVPGAPKRFAQAIGLAVTSLAAVTGFAGAGALSLGLLALLAVFASLEAGLGFCAGCWAYGQLARAGVITDPACVECADISLRRA